MKFPFSFTLTGMLIGGRYCNIAIGGLGEEGERVKNGEGGESGIQEVLTEVKTEKRGDEAKGKTETRRNFGKKRGAAKIFPRKFCGLKNYLYVCSA